jgi:hypothetical protein
MFASHCACGPGVAEHRHRPFPRSCWRLRNVSCWSSSIVMLGGASLGSFPSSSHDSSSYVQERATAGASEVAAGIAPYGARAERSRGLLNIRDFPRHTARTETKKSQSQNPPSPAGQKIDRCPGNVVGYRKSPATKTRLRLKSVERNSGLRCRKFKTWHSVGHAGAVGRVLVVDIPQC